MKKKSTFLEIGAHIIKQRFIEQTLASLKKNLMTHTRFIEFLLLRYFFFSVRWFKKRNKEGILQNKI